MMLVLLWRGGRGEEKPAGDADEAAAELRGAADTAEGSSSERAVAAERACRAGDAEPRRGPKTGAVAVVVGAAMTA
jgi:hypothetical protein